MQRKTGLAALAVLAIALAALAWALHRPAYAPYAALELAAAPSAPGALRITFMGTTTVLLSDGETALLVDGFFSRPDLWTVLAGRVTPDPGRIDAGLARAGITRLAAVMTAHSHYDHALDAAEVTRRTGAVLIGSISTANIGRGAGLAEDRLVTIAGGERLAFGRFSVRFFRSLHAPGAFYPGEIAVPLAPPARAGDYKEGGSFTFLFEHDGRRVLVHPSANFVPGMYRDVGADVVLFGAGTLGKGDDAFVAALWREVVTATHAGLVLPIHWDDFFAPAGETLQPMPRLMGNFERAMQRLQRLSQEHGVSLRLLPLYVPVDVFAQPPAAPAR